MITPAQLAQKRREDARRDVLAYLAIRNALAFRVTVIRNRLNQDNTTDYSDEEIRSALVTLEGLSDVTHKEERLGAEQYFRVTAQGQLNYEREALHGS